MRKNNVTSKKRILIVEDEMPIRVMMNQFFSAQGYESALVSDAEQALEFLKKETPDLVITDVMFPGMDGWELCKAIKGNPRTKSVPVIVLTGKATALEVMAYESGADSYLSKPFSNDELIRIVQGFLYKKQ